MTAILERLFGVEGMQVVVTGGSRGIGAMIARGFVEAGAHVYISARKSADCDAPAAAPAALAVPGSCQSNPADFSPHEGGDAQTATITKRPARPVHVPVNNTEV